MRMNDRLNLENGLAKRMMDAHFHEFVEKESLLSDVELSIEMGLSVREIRALKRKLGR